MSEINLGIPPVKRTLAPRSKTRKIMVGSISVDGDVPVSVQSMTTTLTSNVGATLQQIVELTAAGYDIIRMACPSKDDVETLPETCKHSSIPVVADIHFQSRYVFQAIEAGCGAVRVNPGNIRAFDDQVREIAKAANGHGTALRIGVSAGSLDRHLYEKYGGATLEVLVKPAVWETSLFEDMGFHDFAISVKHYDPLTMIQAYRLLFQAGEWPLHLGVTEAGPQLQGTIKSATAFGILLSEGVGDTIRVSLSVPPVEGVKVGLGVLRCLGLHKRNFEIISCPSCEHSQVDVCALANEVNEGLKDITYPLRVAVMGCIVDSPGEAREADLGVASGNGKSKIFIKGRVIKIMPESGIVTTLIAEANRLGQELGLDSGSPTVETFGSAGAGNRS